jgi:hypothetical protein
LVILPSKITSFFPDSSFANSDNGTPTRVISQLSAVVRGKGSPTRVISQLSAVVRGKAMDYDFKG